MPRSDARPDPAEDANTLHRNPEDTDGLAPDSRAAQREKHAAAPPTTADESYGTKGDGYENDTIKPPADPSQREEGRRTPKP